MALGTQQLLARPQAGPSNPRFPLGLIVSVGNDPEAAIRKVHDLELPTCEVLVESFGSELAASLVQALEHYNIKATSLFSLGPGAKIWNFYQGPTTIGLVPPEWRHARIDGLKQASDFAKRCGIPLVQTHCGFIPEDPNTELYKGAVEAIWEVANHCRGNGQTFLYHTGQETPVTLLRAIEDVGLDNQGIGLDAGNLLLYGKANPVDALDVIGPYVRGVHAKDGLYPTNPRLLGKEVPIGQGKVDFPKFLQRLKEIGYQGAITIEREISGAQQIEDVRKSITFLNGIINGLG
jgi:L-ribulose-5-phosphate 3-epimerase